MTHGLQTLTEKEKQTLRLVVRGHDAKSMARALDLSVHTINERLRAARRKLSVTSSREAARVLMESEEGRHEYAVNKGLGDADPADSPDDPPITKRGRTAAFGIGGVFVMITLALALTLGLASTATQDRVAGDPTTAIEQAHLEDMEAAARRWLELVDSGDWEASFAATGRSFREANTVATWRDASLQARVPLGAMITREATTAEFVNAPPEGFYIVRFRTRFANRDGAIESVTLEKDNGVWKAVAFVID